MDFILGDGAVAIESKATENPTSDHLKGLRAWREEQRSKRCILVTRVPHARKTANGIEILPWQLFLRQLWNSEFPLSYCKVARQILKLVVCDLENDKVRSKLVKMR